MVYDPFSPKSVSLMTFLDEQQLRIATERRVKDLEEGNARLRQRLAERPLRDSTIVSDLYALRRRMQNAIDGKLTRSGAPTVARLNEYVKALNAAFQAMRI